MPHLVTSPIASASLDKSRGGSRTVMQTSSAEDSSSQQPMVKDFRLLGCYDEEEGLATMISPEQEIPTKRNLSRVEWGRDDRELAAMQTMLELPHMPPSPASDNATREGYNNNNVRRSKPSVNSSPAVGNSCYKPQPRSFVPYLSTRGRGALAHYYATSSRPHTVVVGPHAPPFSPRQYSREDVTSYSSSPHAPFMSGQPRGLPHVSQRGGARGGIVVSRGRRQPRYDTIPYYYEHEYYPRHPYYYTPPAGAAEPRKLSMVDTQDELEQENEQAQASFDQDSVMEEAQVVMESTHNQPLDERVIMKEPVPPKDDLHYHPYYPYSSYSTGAYPPPPPYAPRYPLRPATLFQDHHARPQNLNPPSRHPTRGLPPTVVYDHRAFAGQDSVTPNKVNNSRSRSKSGIMSNSSLQQQPTIVSLERCIPMKGLVPSKFWGDINKFKDAYVPVFDQLVNFPDHLSKYQSSKQLNSRSSSMQYRNCVMCGALCICTASAELYGAMASLKDESSSADGSPPSSIKGSESGGAIIPRQNKGICTKCDVIVWVIAETGLQIKWCKGCKNFRSWAAFGEKGGATKCTKCRDRQREKYAAQKTRVEVESTKKRKIDSTIDGEVASTESSKKHMAVEMINDPGLTQTTTTEQREDKEHEDEESDQLQW